jgi:SAM-dependent methyltransferase
MPFAEQVLFVCAKWLYRTEISLSEEMKESLTDADKYDAYRSALVPHIVLSAKRLGLEIAGKTVLDVGCGDGAITREFLKHGAARVIGIDADANAIARGRENHASDVDFHLCSNGMFPLETSSVDAIVSHDVFEHISDPSQTLSECYRVLRPGGRMLIGTWGWYHPFASHLFSTMPVPWAHVIFSERTLLRAARKVYQASWYRPTMHDLDADGRKIPDKYSQEHISPEYLNKLLVRDFRRIFKDTEFDVRMELVPFGSRYARWTRAFLQVPLLNEFVTSYFWAVLSKSDDAD